MVTKMDTGDHFPLRNPELRNLNAITGPTVTLDFSECHQILGEPGSKFVSTTFIARCWIKRIIRIKKIKLTILLLIIKNFTKLLKCTKILGR